MIKDHAEFNRLLNIAQHFRTLRSGKKVPVKGHRRTLARIQAGLEDLRKRGRNEREYLYLVNPHTGILSQADKGDLVNAGVNNIMAKALTPEKVDGVTEGLSKRWMLHNHPVRSSLSLLDLASGGQYNANIYAINTTGSVFRGYAKEGLLRQPELHAVLAGDIAFNIQDVKKFIPNTTTDERMFLVSHYYNKSLHNQGLIHYRAKLSKPDQQLVDKYGDQMDMYMEHFVDYKQRMTDKYQAGIMDDELTKYLNNYQAANEYYYDDPKPIIRQSLLEKSKNRKQETLSRLAGNERESAQRELKREQTKRRKLRESLTTKINRETGQRENLSASERYGLIKKYNEMNLY